MINDTIFAIATGLSTKISTGLSVIRISGYNCKYALSLTKLSQAKTDQFDISSIKYFESLKSLPLKPKYAKFSKFYSNKGQFLDEGILLYFQNPNSYTGEDVIELQIHGARYNIQNFLYELGNIPSFRLAENGEFTRRAYINDKISLQKLEGLNDLLTASSKLENELALEGLAGQKDQKLLAWLENVKASWVNLQAYIDFGEDEGFEGLENFLQEKVQKNLDFCIKDIQKSLNKQFFINEIKEGSEIGQIGGVNVGKSTLMNNLALKEVSIVTEIAGTTRDIVSEVLEIGGRKVIMKDTAGLRQSDEKIEKIGIKKSQEVLDKAKIALLVISSEDLIFCDGKFSIREDCKGNYEWLQNLYGKFSEKIIICVNKIDVLSNFEDIVNLDQIAIENFFIDGKSLKVDVVTSFMTNIDESRQRVYEVISKRLMKLQMEFDENDIESFDRFVSNKRQCIELESCVRNLEDFKTFVMEIKGNQCGGDMGLDIAGEFLKDGMDALGRLGGTVTQEEVIDNIFRNFCIGK